MSGRRFTFRAQAALDLRHREYDAARRVLAQVETDLRAAQDVLKEASQCAVDARAQFAARVQQPDGHVQQQWYRSWIMKLDRERALAATTVKAREADAARAAMACTISRQRVESLDRFKEKAHQEWQRLALADEQKHLDALATMRFTAASRVRG